VSAFADVTTVRVEPFTAWVTHASRRRRRPFFVAVRRELDARLTILASGSIVEHGRPEARIVIRVGAVPPELEPALMEVARHIGRARR